ncbi:MAG: DUF3108 domain-containing protein, partial [Pseudomonadota bacterium]
MHPEDVFMQQKKPLFKIPIVRLRSYPHFFSGAQMIGRQAALFLFFKCTLVLSLSSALAGEKIPFHPGEKLHFKVYWTEILAGEATLEVLPIEKFNGMPAYHFAMTATTVPFVDAFYMVRDRLESY